MTRLTDRNIELADAASIEMFRNRTPEDRRRIASGMFDMAKARLTDHLRHRHPEWDEQTLQREVIKRIQHESD